MVLSSLFFWAFFQAGMVASHEALPEPTLAKPALGAQYADPVFGTKIKRLTDAKSQGSEGIVCYYSKLNPFNADETKILVYGRGGYWFLYNIDGAFAGKIPVWNSQTDPQPRWHPANPNVMYWFDANKIIEYNIATSQKNIVAEFPQYTFVTNHDEGNYSVDGRWIGLAGRHWPWFTGLQEFFVYDLKERKVVSPKIAGTGHNVDWVSISPQGNYFVVLTEGDAKPTEVSPWRWSGLDVYDVPAMQIRPLAYYRYTDHADMGIDADGAEIYVTDNAEDAFPDNLRHIEKYRLADGKKTDLLGMDWSLGRYVSCRNFAAPGWAIISTEAKPELSQRVSFEDEIFALKLDGSGEVRRVAHHRSQRYSHGDYSYDNYWDQPNAAISRSGKYILFSSNWRELGQPQDVYLIDLTEQEGWITERRHDGIAPRPPTGLLLK